MKCQNCNKEFEGTSRAKFCSDKCRVQFSRNSSVTKLRNKNDNVTEKIMVDVTETPEPETFEYTIIIGDRDDAETKKKKNTIRTARYWYEVPISGVPRLKAGWPKKPDYMDGRQYFLWHQNAFKVNETGNPVIYNPHPTYDKLTYTGKPTFYGGRKV